MGSIFDFCSVILLFEIYFLIFAPRACPRTVFRRAHPPVAEILDIYQTYSTYFRNTKLATCTVISGEAK